jgi:polysaccharide export outer membrane protein
LSIAVFSDDALATAAVTNPMASTALTSIANSPSGTGYASNGAQNAGNAGQNFLVNKNGDIMVYKLGQIPAIGKTRQQLADTLASIYSQQGLLKNPMVDVRYLNFKVTIIGEVNKPGQYVIPIDKMSVWEAVGLAGDITIYGRRDNVLVVREANGVRQFGKLDLKDPNVFLSPYYYLQQNDLVIVDVTKNKAALNDQATLRNISIGTSFLSVVAIFVSIFRR